MDSGTLALAIAGFAQVTGFAAIAFAFNMAQRVTKTETKLDFIYDRVRVNVATAAHEPHDDARIKDKLIEKFVQKRIEFSEVRTLAQILETERQFADDKKKALRAENLLELIRYEYQL